MNCFESVYIPLDEIHVRNKSKSLDIKRAGMFGRGTANEFGKLVPDKLSLLDVFQQYLSAVQDYSTRDLSYDADSLNAFQGIIQRYSKLKQPVNAIWGVPYPAESQGREEISCFCWALTWSHTQNCWESSRGPRRRQQFPSWTWAGWAGSVQFKQRSGKLFLVKIFYGIKSVLFGDDGNETWELSRLNHSTPESKCRVLQLLAKAPPPSLFSCHHTEDGKTSWTFAQYKAELFSSRSSVLTGQFVQELMDVKRWRCIWICSVLKSSFVMLLEPSHDTGAWTRAGMFCVECSDYQMKPLLKDIEAIWFKIE